MATSPNYSWPEPDNTDLVKNGALAMRTLGNAIDTTMATMTPKSIVDAKGDLIAATANDTPARLAVGNNGNTLVADSSTATGLRWQGSMAAAKNGITNGLMDIWQRGTTFTDGDKFISDRWHLIVGTGTVTSTQETTIVPEGCQYSWKLTKSAGSSSATFISQTIESANAIPFANKTVTISYFAAATASSTFNLNLKYSTSVDNPRTGTWTNITPTVDGTTAVSTTTFVRIISTFSVPSTAKSLQVSIEPPVPNGGSIYISGFQMEIGSVATTLTRSDGTIQGELAACQRYYWRTSGQTGTASPKFGDCFKYTSGDFMAHFKLPVTMRIIPTTVDYSGVTFYTNNLTANSVSGIAGNDDWGNENMACIVGAQSGVAVNTQGFFGGNATTSYIGFSAEL